MLGRPIVGLRLDEFRRSLRQSAPPMKEVLDFGDPVRIISSSSFVGGLIDLRSDGGPAAALAHELPSHGFSMKSGALKWSRCSHDREHLLDAVMATWGRSSAPLSGRRLLVERSSRWVSEREALGPTTVLRTGLMHATHNEPESKLVSVPFGHVVGTKCGPSNGRGVETTLELGLSGGRDRRRSGDLTLFRRALYQLSYPTG